MIRRMNGLLLLLLAQAAANTSGASSIEKGTQALADFRPEAAVALLEQARSEGPYRHEQHVKLYEQLGVAYAYLERADDAVEAFGIMLALQPTAAISYTLSPKVTFLFERARKKAMEAPTPSIDLSWPKDLRVDQAVPVDVELLADPKGFLKRARLFHRVKGAIRYQKVQLSLPKIGGRKEVRLPPSAPASKRTEVLELYLIGEDERGNEVLRWGTPTRPREVPLRYEPPDPWYGKWWVWVAAGAVVAASGAAAAVAVTREPSPTVDGVFGVVVP